MLIVSHFVVDGFDETRPLVIAVAWLIALAVAVTVTYRVTVRPRHPLDAGLTS